MTFRITVERLPLRLDFEVGSIEEGVAALQEKNTTIRQMIALADDMAAEAVSGDTANEAPATGAEPARKPRGRTAKNQPDPSTATAPPPLAVPPVAAPPVAPAAPVDTAPAADGGIPPFLQRTAAPAPPPPPPAPLAPSGILAGKVIANLDQRKTATPDGGKGLADWLAQCGLVQAGASYDEAVAVVRMTADDKLVAIAGQLGVA